MEERDEELMKRFQGGEEAAFVAIIQKYQQKLFNFFLRQLHDYATAEDLTQDVFIRVFKYGRSFDCARKFKPWFYRIAVHQLNKERKSRTREIALADDIFYGLLPGSETDYDNIARIKNAIKQLPHTQQEVVVLKHYQGMTFTEIAEATGCPEGTIKTRFYQAFKKLRIKLIKSGRKK